MVRDGYCRVPGCRQYGLHFKRLDRHLKHIHRMSIADNEKLCPEAEADLRTFSENNDRPRQPCKIESCRYYNKVLSRLDKHIVKKHKMTMSQYYGYVSSKNNNGTANETSQAEECPPESVDCSFSEDEEDTSTIQKAVDKILHNL